MRRAKNMYIYFGIGLHIVMHILGGRMLLIVIIFNITDSVVISIAVNSFTETRKENLENNNIFFK